jgi:hypothetical protein
MVIDHGSPPLPFGLKLGWINFDEETLLKN